MKLRHFITKAVSLLMTMLTVTAVSIPAFAAESSVSFESGKLIAFGPGSVYTDSDLFDNFKGVMPGDVRSEKITIENNSDECDYIKVYLRAVLYNEEGNPISEKVLEELRSDERRGETSELQYMHDFLSQLSMTVKNGTKVLYSASPDEPGGLSENVYLGRLVKGASMDLDVELKVPVTMGNEYANRIGELDWAFVVEGFDETDPPSYDKTMLTVRKVWVDDGIDRPGSVTVQLLRDGKEYDKVELSQSNNWAYTWDRLDEDCSWSVVEINVPTGYKVRYNTTGNRTTIINTENGGSSGPSGPSVPSGPVAPGYPTGPTGPNGPNNPADPTGPTDPNAPTDPDKPVHPVDLGIKKKWDDDGRNRPESVKITLYDGENAVESVWLGEWNNWTYTWRNLDGRGNWQILETDIPRGYVPSYYYENGIVTVTNTATLIQTGQFSWPIPVMGALGLVLITYGVFIILKKRKNEDA